jgi:anti-sigma B factor antagonist
MRISSRTPDGETNRCPICGNAVRIEPSEDTRDAPCPHCGHLLWFDQPFMQITINPADGSTVVRFVHKELIYDTIDTDLFRLVDEFGRHTLRLDFSAVTTFSSSILGKLVTLHRKLQSVRGKLVLCGLSDEMMSVFKICKLDRLIEIEMN